MIRELVEKAYRSPLGNALSAVANLLAEFQKPFMVYGFVDPATRQFRKYTRISSTATIMNKKRLSVQDQVWVWHYTILDATEGITIGEGTQIGAYVGIFTHGSENSIRLLGRQFVHIPNTQRKGYTRGSVTIGAYNFIGAGSVILPGVTIGNGCLIGTGALVTKNVPDYSVVVGAPGKVIGSTLDIDARFIAENDFSDTYYDKTAYALIREKLAAKA